MKRSLALNFLLTCILKRKKLKSIKKEKRKRWTYENMAHSKAFKHS